LHRRRIASVGVRHVPVRHLHDDDHFVGALDGEKGNPISAGVCGTDEGAAVEGAMRDDAGIRRADLGVAEHDLGASGVGVGDQHLRSGILQVGLGLDDLGLGRVRLELRRRDSDLGGVLRADRGHVLVFLLIHDPIVDGLLRVEFLHPVELLPVVAPRRRLALGVGFGQIDERLGGTGLRLAGDHGGFELLHVGFGALHGGFVALHLLLELGHGELGEDLPFLHTRAEVHVLLAQKPGNLGVQVDRYGRFECAGLDADPVDPAGARRDHFDADRLALGIRFARSRRGRGLGVEPADSIIGSQSGDEQNGWGDLPKSRAGPGGGKLGRGQDDGRFDRRGGHV